MKKFLLFCIPFLSFSQSNEIKDVFPLLVVDSPPLFNNCLNFEESEQIKCFKESVNNHISTNLIFPEESFDTREGGRVFVNFTYDKKGSVSDINVKGPNENLENEVTRVIKLLPDLFPAKKDGKDVAVSYALPVDFFLLTQFNNNEITIKKGSNIYESADTRSKSIFFTTNETILNATMRGDFWLTELNAEGTYLGYVYKDDVIEINNTNKSEYAVKEPILSKTLITDSSNTIIFNEIKKNNILDTLTLKNNIVSRKEENLPLSKIQLAQLKLDSDLDNLDYFEQKLNNQQEINRKIDGFNNSDLYYTNALKVFIKILKDDIDIKYTLLSIDNPEAFKNSIYELKKVKTSQKKVQKLKNRNKYITNQFIQKNFYSYPDDSNIIRLNELIDGLKKLEYVIDTDVEIFNLINKNNLSNITRNEIGEKEESEIIISDDLIEDGNLNNTVQINSPTELYVKKTVVNDYGISGLRSETKEVYQKIQNTPDRRNIKTTIVKPSQENIVEKNNDNKVSQENIVEKNNDNKVSRENYQVSVNEAKEKFKQLTSLYNQDLISKELYDESSTKFKEIIQSESQVSVDEAKEKLKQLASLYNQDLISKELYEESSTKFKEIIQSESQVSVDEAKEKLKQLASLYNQDLISKELYEESSTKFKLIIEIDSINKLKSLEIPDITDDEALERLKTLKSLYDQELIDKETYDSSTEILKKIIIGN